MILIEVHFAPTLDGRRVQLRGHKYTVCSPIDDRYCITITSVRNQPKHGHTRTDGMGKVARGDKGGIRRCLPANSNPDIPPYTASPEEIELGRWRIGKCGSTGFRYKEGAEQGGEEKGSESARVIGRETTERARVGFSGGQMGDTARHGAGTSQPGPSRPGY